jgi:AcrR family transcriptional regulator
MIAEGATVDTLSIGAIADRAGVGKATIYRRWPNKQRLVMEAIARLEEPVDCPAGDSVRNDLISALTDLRDWASQSLSARAFPIMLSGRQQFPDLVKKYTDAVIAPRLKVLQAVLQRGVAVGVLRPDLNVALAARLLAGIALSHVALGSGPGSEAGAGADAGLQGFDPGDVVDWLLSGIRNRVARDPEVVVA